MKRADLQDKAPIGHTGYSYIMEYIWGSRLTEESSLGGWVGQAGRQTGNQVEQGG